MKALFFLLFCLASGLSMASQNLSEDEDESTRLSELIQEYQALEESYDKGITSLLMELHKERNKGESPTTLFGQKKEKNSRVRAAILEDSVMSQIDEMESLQSTIKALQEQLVLLSVQKELSPESDFRVEKAPKKKEQASASCKKNPVPRKQELSLLRGFGTQVDKETKLSWEHPGWLIKTGKGSVLSCLAGTVAFFGNVHGRGLVLMIKSKDDLLVTYGNLESIPKSLRRIGARVRVNQSIGTSSEETYLETRKNGIAKNPSLLFGEKLALSQPANP